MHHLIMGLIMTVVTFVVLSRCGSTPSLPPQGGAPSQVVQAVEQVPIPAVQQAAHDLIDLQATVLKTQVDLALKAWERLTLDQRRQLYSAIRTAVQEWNLPLPGVRVMEPQK
jgi:hypothetical protein